MPRDFFIQGESMVAVKGGQQWSGNPIANLSELGLSVDGITVSPRFVHGDYKADDFAGIPPDVQWMLGEIKIGMTLIHADQGVLDVCVSEAMGSQAGVFAPGEGRGAGTPLGKGLPMFSSGNALISLNVLNEMPNALFPLGRPWRFKSCYLAEAPFVFPLGVKVSAIQLNWRCIPYLPLFLSGQYFASGTLGTNPFREVSSSGMVLWDRTLDT